MFRVQVGFIRTAFRDVAIYRVDFWIGLLSTFFVMYAIASIWFILYQQAPNAFGVTLQQMTSYGVLGVLLSPVMQAATRTRNYIASQVRSGSIEIDLMKPVGFLAHMLARNIGEVAVIVLLRGVPGFVFAFLVLDMQLPADARHAVACGVSVALGYLVSFGISFLIGLLSLVTHDIRSYNWAFSALIRFASGEVIPLWLFPPLLGAIVAALPFQAIYFVPLSIYVGAQQGNLAQTLLSQGLWVAGVLACCQLAWLGCQRRIVVQGG